MSDRSEQRTKQYTRIGWVAKCHECGEELSSFWTVSKHHFLEHTWTGRLVSRVA